MSPQDQANKRRPNFWSRQSLIQITLFGVKTNQIHIPQKAPPAPKLKKRPKCAVVLGGGGARGFAHIGVLKVLQQAGIPIDLVVGTSVGALIGSIYCDKPEPQHMEHMLRRIQTKDLLDLAIFQLRSGIFTGQAMQNYIAKTLAAQDFSALKIKLVATTVDMGSGEVIPLESGPIAPAINASCALPPFFKPVPLYGYNLADGGIVDPVPVTVAQLYEPHTIIAVNVSPETTTQWAKNLLTGFVRSYNMTIARLSSVHAQQANIVIEPDILNTELFDFSNKWTLYQNGQAAATEQLDTIKQHLYQQVEADDPSNC